ncbi:MAG TPA: carboxypeptidase-like regulatory domain-containing protein [Gemmatimonadales bacterium]|nr:carboxypeptidase-like regulatory domain-containing protein [Gemmatimonadales bacterium]
MQRFAAFAALLCVTSSRLAAQAAITGVIKEDSSKAKVAGVEVIIQSLDKKATTDTAGRFTLAGLDHGIHIILVRGIGYQPIRLQAYLVTNDTLEVELSIRKSVVELAPLEVTASAVPSGLQEFEERRNSAMGEFIDWTRLRKEEFRRTSDMFRGIHGVRIGYDRNGQAFLTSSRGSCPMQIVLDGLAIYKSGQPGGPPSIDLWSIANLDAIEVYRGPSTTPMPYTGKGAGCGTVVLWTRRH